MTARNSMELLDSDAAGLVHVLWPSSLSAIRSLFNGDPTHQLSNEAYYDYYRRQWHVFALYGDRQHAAARTPEAILGLAQDIQDGKSWEELIAGLKSTNAAEEACERSINLAVRLLVMMRFGVSKHQVSSRRSLQWNKGTLRDCVHGLFSEPPKLSFEQVRLPKSFDAWSIASVGGIEIAFTDNLADHLLLVEDDTKLLVFHHASFLEYHRTCQNSVFPDGLVDETLRTLALLFPQSQFSNHQRARNPRRKWLQALRTRHRETEQTVIDPRLALCGTPQGEDRQIERFQFSLFANVVYHQLDHPYLIF